MVGGGSVIPGLPARLLAEVRSLTPLSVTPGLVVTPEYMPQPQVRASVCVCVCWVYVCACVLCSSREGVDNVRLKCAEHKVWGVGRQGFAAVTGMAGGTRSSVGAERQAPAERCESACVDM